MCVRVSDKSVLYVASVFMCVTHSQLYILHSINDCLSLMFLGFSWNLEEDFKSVPEQWIPAHRVKHDNGRPIPDQLGHIPGK